MRKGKIAQTHLHTGYSLKDSMLKIDQIMKRAKELDLYAVAITDHGNMFGAVEFAQQAKKAGVKYMIGSEAYIDPRGIKARGSRDNRHVILIAKDDIGYKNLCTLMSIASIDGYYYAPRIDHDLLEEYSEGLICTSACLAGDVAREIKNAVDESNLEKDWSEGYKRGRERAEWYKSIFGDDFYIEIQDNGIKDQYLCNDVLIKIARDLDIKIIIANDAHYMTRDMYEHHDVFMAYGAGTTVDDDKRKKYTSDEFFIKGYDDFFTGRIPDALVEEAAANTIKIADKCTFEMEFGTYHIPVFPDVPDGMTNTEFLKQLGIDGLKERYADTWEELKDSVYLPRLEYELGIIQNMGFNDYFLIVWDFVDYAIRKGYGIGPGRGSGAGSILAYGLYITHIDPIAEDLIFERLKEALIKLREFRGRLYEIILSQAYVAIHLKVQRLGVSL